MFKCAPGVAAFVALCFPLAAQATLRFEFYIRVYRRIIFTSVDSSALVRELPMTELLTGVCPARPHSAEWERRRSRIFSMALG